jgi:glycosyltransferase involved in cell wall biosynthesis
MGKYKICVYAICKNEQKFVDKWMDSMEKADLVVVTDTGSSDETAAKLRERGAVVYEEEIAPWRFDVARNKSLEHVPQDVDICVCTDLDEVFTDGWRESLESAWQPDTTTGKYLYNWSLKPDNTPDIQFNYFKVHARNGYKWVHPIHECLAFVGTPPEQVVYIPGMVLNHYPDPSKSRGSYLPLLEMAVQESPADDRMVYYLGREYMYQAQWEKCIHTLRNYLQLPGAWWNEERCAAMRWIAASYNALKDTTQAYGWYFRAVAEAPHMREPYVECARMAYGLHDWPAAFYMAQEALKIKSKSPTYINMGYCWDYTPDDYCAIACYWLGIYDLALEHAKAALQFSPNDERLANNLRLVEEKIKK